jgi:D-alanyl-D-alanine carboxypeptidase/D-alanyl-D-alanine-endopeptidase (penicillin-binding protein 4)
MKKTAFSLSYSALIFAYSLFASCKTTAHISLQAEKTLIVDTAISKGFIGISVFDPSTNSYLYNYNADKYFVPASNVKLFTLYAGMKYLGDSLVGIRYNIIHDKWTEIYSSGDPTFLCSEFKNQPVLDFLKKQKNILVNRDQYLSALGYGWAWDDYKEDYMTGRSTFPMYKNIVTLNWISSDSINVFPSFFRKTTRLLSPLDSGMDVRREFDNNEIIVLDGSVKSKTIPFVPGMLTFIDLLADTLKKDNIAYTNHVAREKIKGNKIIYSQPSDSLFKPMMHYSDNFFAEQTLLMASNEHLGYMNDEAIIDTLLKTHLKDIPQKPKWVDGSGLSRYNLFTPKDFIYILNKMKNEFGMDRMKNILATGGEGTLKNYFKKDAGFIFAKTGTLSNNCALSGYIITKKNRLLIFSILANNYQTGATPVRKAVEKFLEYLRDVH